MCNIIHNFLFLDVHLLNDRINNTKATTSEDSKILELVQQYGLGNWAKIATSLGSI